MGVPTSVLVGVLFGCKTYGQDEVVPKCAKKRMYDPDAERGFQVGGLKMTITAAIELLTPVEPPKEDADIKEYN